MKNSKNITKFLMLIIILILISSCSQMIIPKGRVKIRSDLIEERKIPDKISNGKIITIINAQEDRSKKLIGKSVFGTNLETNLNEVTNNLIKNLSNEYKKRGVNINGIDYKKLDISVNKVVLKLPSTAFVFIYVSIKSSDGKINKNIIQKGEDFFDGRTAFKKAIRNVVIYILTDEEITAFINS